MIIRNLLAGALALALLAVPAVAQETKGTQPQSIAKGGTGASTPAAARTNLGVTATGADTAYNFRANNLSDVVNAATARTNLGLAIGSNVEAWDADLDCIAALSSTGLIKRTGAGTCAAGTAALSDLAAGTQDTVIGYFGSTTASAATMPNCANALTYSTSTHTFGCNVSGGTGTVIQVNTGAGTTGGPITTTGTISAADGVTIKTAYAEQAAFSGVTNSMAGGVDTIPQQTDGAEFISVAFTPSLSTSTLLIEVTGQAVSNGTQSFWGALFQDSIAGALAAQLIGGAGADVSAPILLRYQVTSGSTSSRTYKFRLGNFNGVSNTISVNGITAGRRLGGSSRLTITVRETKA